MRRVGPYFAVVVLTSLLLVYALRLWRADPTVPFVNPGEGDTTYELAVAKGIIETGWHTHTPRTSAPGELDNKDFPRPDTLHFGLWRLIGTLYPNPAFVFNIVGFLSYPFAAFTMMLVLRQLGISHLTAMAFAILYAFLPFHMARWIAGHMLLVMYYTVPLLSLLALWFCAGRIPFLRRNEAGRYCVHLWNRETAFAVVLAVWAGSTSVYYAFFGCFFIVVGGLMATGRLRSLAPVASALVFGALCGASMTMNTLPNRRYVQEHGLNCVVASRVPEEADIYGLRIAQLLLPRPQHRLDAFEYLRTKYEGRGIPEGANNALGVLGSIGFVALLGGLFWRRSREHLFDHLALLLLAGVLLGTIGAFGSLFNFLVNADIRAYNRIVVYLAFFAFTATAMGVDRWLHHPTPFGPRWRTRPLGPRGKLLACVLLVAFGYWDQTSGKVPAYDRNATKYHAREAYVQSIEAQVPYGAMIFQLPFMPYTEAGPILGIPDYSHALCYVHSQHTRWTYPAFSNRPPARWQEWVADQPTGTMVRILALAGFQGMHVDGRGYHDRGQKLVHELQALLGQPPHASDDGHFFYFDLGDYTLQLRQTMTATAWEEEATLIRERPYFLVQAGFRLGSVYREGRYLSAVRSKMALGNPSASPVKVQFRCQIQRFSDRASTLHVRGLGAEQTIEITPTPTYFTFDLELPPGQHVVEWEMETTGTLHLMPNRLTEVWLVDKISIERR